MESIHDIYKGFLTYDDCQDITAHQCSVDPIELYSDHLAVHLTSHIKLELSVEKGTKEGEAFQALQEKHSQVLVECQLN